MTIGPVQPTSHLPAVETVQPNGEQLAAHREVVKAVTALNKSELLGENNELTFTMDRNLHRPVIQIVDRKTREVIQQIPPEYVLEAAANLTT